MTTTAAAKVSRSAPAEPVSRPPVPPRPSDRRTLVTASILVAWILLAWGVLYLLVLSDVSQQRAQSELYRAFRADLASATAPVGGQVPLGAPVAILRVPAVGMEQVVVEGTSSADLKSGPGHRRDTVLPGQVGTSVIFGKALTAGAPFGDLGHLTPGEKLEVVTQQGTADFKVTNVRRNGDPIPAPLTSDQARVTLVSLEGAGTLSALSPDKQVFVDAVRVDGNGWVPPPGRLAAVPASEQALGSDSGALPVLVVWLAALMGAVAGAVLAAKRLRPVVLWLLASPVLLALAWVAADAAARLLPNLL